MASRRPPSSTATTSSQSASPSSTSGSAPPPSRSNTSRDERFMSACSAMIGCARCRSGSCNSATWRKARGTLPPRRSSTTPITRSVAASCIPLPRTSRRNCARGSSARPSGSIARSSSMAMPASIFASQPTAPRISSKPTPIPRLRRARSSRRRHCMTGSPIQTCCNAL
jgi:hypothetical protein